MMMPAALFFAFISTVMLSYFILPDAYVRVAAYNQKRVYQFNSRLERVVPRSQVKQVVQMYMLAPLAFAGLFYVFLPEGEAQIYGIIAGLIAGLIFPTFYTKFLVVYNKKKFSDQLIDSLMILSSSFRGGLSLIQAMEAVVEEMGDPTKQEFSTVLGENKMGVSLEESLEHLYARQPSPALQQVITAILLARETGGNLPVIFQRIVGVIRQRKRIQGQIDTLTLQGKLQGVVMSLLPVAFFFFINASNPDHFRVMWETDIGKTLMTTALVLEVVGAALIWKISSFKDY